MRLFAHAATPGWLLVVCRWNPAPAQLKHTTDFAAVMRARPHDDEAFSANAEGRNKVHQAAAKG